MNDPIDPATVEKAARAGFAAAAANAVRKYGLDEPITWDEYLNDDDREHELIRTRAALSAAAPLIAEVAAAKNILRMAPHFWSRVEVRKSWDDCWEWTGPALPFGHGRYDSVAGNTAHRFAWALENLTLPPKSAVVRHLCDNPPCCNPRHLLLGSQQDNVQDMVDRGRANWSESECRNGHPRLGNQRVRPDGTRRCRLCDEQLSRERHQVRYACWVCGKGITQYNLVRHLANLHGVSATPAEVRARADALEACCPHPKCPGGSLCCCADALEAGQP